MRNASGVGEGRAKKEKERRLQTPSREGAWLTPSKVLKAPWSDGSLKFLQPQIYAFGNYLQNICNARTQGQKVEEFIV
jgi:hypothetical protein